MVDLRFDLRGWILLTCTDKGSIIILNNMSYLGHETAEERYRITKQIGKRLINEFLCDDIIP